MANMCSNFVTFSGRNAHKMMEYLREFAHPDSCEVEQDMFEENNNLILGYYFEDICLDYPDGLTASYLTRLNTNLEDMMAIADAIGNVSFTLSYEEMGSEMYGMATYSDGVLRVTDLDMEEIDQFKDDGDTDWEMVDTYLERKHKRNDNTEIVVYIDNNH